MTDPEIRTQTLEYHPAESDARKVFARSGLEYLRAMATGAVAYPPIGSHIGLRVVSVENGDIVMTAEPNESHYNPLGSVQGGFFATILDAACGCAAHSTLPAGVGYTSLDLKVSFLRPVTADTGTVTAHGWVTKGGRNAAFTEADLRDAAGLILATASSTCLIVRLDVPQT
ncbi:PaaI family thioesterase [Microbacterium sp. A93]|uniref:PaaI family thioesterase n=1 Tax=unclassified Microbacterium TaxID=2609290 RepID=UPI003F4344EB